MLESSRAIVHSHRSKNAHDRQLPTVHGPEPHDPTRTSVDHEAARTRTTEPSSRAEVRTLSLARYPSRASLRVQRRAWRDVLPNMFFTAERPQGQPASSSTTVRHFARIERRSCFSPSSMHHAQLSSNNHTTYVHVTVAASVITAAYLLDELATRPDLSSTQYHDAGLCRLHVPLN